MASIGGAVFYALNIPLPFILGGMIFCLAATMLRLPVSTPAAARPPMSATIGVMLGSGFTPEIISLLGNWLVPLAGLALFLVAAGLACVTFYRKVAKYDPATAYLAGMPGGLTEMTLLADAYGADSRRVALAHSARILIVVLTLPFVVEALSGQTIGRGLASSAAPLTLESILWLAGTAAAGALLGHWLKLPARALLGPMAVSAVIHATGISNFKPPAEIVMVAQVVLGASIGCRFAGITVRELGGVMVLAIGSTAVLLLLTLGFAFGTSAFTTFTPFELMLAYSPGGLTEMGLIALALNTDVAFVAGHHIIRVVLVTTGAGLICRRALAPPPLAPVTQDE